MKRFSLLLCIGAVLGVLTAFIEVSACATFKDSARTANDAARILCELFAGEHPEHRAGLSPEQWCQLRENLDPFVREALAAQRRAGLAATQRHAPAP